ncbi:MAG: arginine--tRNA ligase [Candidatus Peribacteria bacterium]|nr:arginine--tRNA ligase [Candidatus Peribacteria bacterium]
MASDLACVKYRMENWSPSKIVYFVDIRQQLHLQQVFEISRLAGWLETSPLTPLLLEERGKNPHPDSLPIGEGEGVKFPLDKGGQGDFLTKKKVTELFHAANGYISLKEGAMSTRH